MSMTQQERLKQLTQLVEVAVVMAKEAASDSTNPWEGQLLERTATSLGETLKDIHSAKRRLELELKYPI